MKQYITKKKNLNGFVAVDSVQCAYALLFPKSNDEMSPMKHRCLGNIRFRLNSWEFGIKVSVIKVYLNSCSFDSIFLRTFKNSLFIFDRNW